MTRLPLALGISISALQRGQRRYRQDLKPRIFLEASEHPFLSPLVASRYFSFSLLRASMLRDMLRPTARTRRSHMAALMTGDFAKRPMHMSPTQRKRRAR